MEPEKQQTSIVIKNIYSQLVHVKTNGGLINYSECFVYGFNMQYDNKYCHLVQERKNVVNNIPYILGAIGRTCNDLGLPPLTSLVINKSTGKCGIGVITSNEKIPEDERIDFAENVDRPAVYACNNYPDPNSQQGQAFISRVIDHLLFKGVTIVRYKE